MQTQEEKPQVVLSLLALVLMTNMFLFSVAYTNASFGGLERPLPDPFHPANISVSFNKALNTIADNLSWSVSTAAAEVKPKIVSFFGLADYKFGMPRYTSLQPSPQRAQNSAVLGASIANPDYGLQSYVPVQPVPQYVVIRIR